MYKNFTIVIPTYNSSTYVDELLSSTLDLIHLNEVIIVDDKSTSEEFNELMAIVGKEKYKNLNIKISQNEVNLGGFRNKRKGVSLSTNEVIYQVDSDNVLTKKTIKFLNNIKNINIVKKGEIYFPSKINLFRKFKIIENALFFRVNDVLFTKSNQTLDIVDVNNVLKDDLSKKFKDRTLKSILNIGNPMFLKTDYMKFTEDSKDESLDNLVACSIALSYFYLKSGGKIVFNKNINHFHRMRSDSAWEEGGEQSKISDLYFLDKIKSSTNTKVKRKQKVHFITYGTNDFRVAKSHLVSLAKTSGFFDEVHNCSQQSLPREFKRKYKQILEHQRGAGYWIWKHEIINKLLSEIHDDDIIVYCDAGSSLNYFAKDRFYDYLNMLNDSEYGNFRIECEPMHKEYKWTTKQLFEYFNVGPESSIYESTQLEATQMIFKKSEHTRNLFDEYRNVLEHDQKLITDRYNDTDQHDGFIENRHDQSIFSLLSKTHGGVIVNNETHFSQGLDQQTDYPFLAVRRHGHGVLDTVKFTLNYKNIKETPVYFSK